jgi:hypothetical protein
MALYLDTEFNGFQGSIISIGIISSVTGKEFYEVFKLPELIHPWVKENVIPILQQQPEDYQIIRHRLYQYLKYHDGEPVIADWPEDLAHLLKLLCDPYGNGMAFNLELDLRLIQSGELKSEIHHNALSDARALMHWHVSQKQ